MQFTELPVSISKKMRDVRVMEGDTATFTCYVTRTNAEIQWLKNGHPIPKSQTRFSETVENKALNLIIKDAKLDDDAEYTVICGDAKCSAHLYVEGTNIETIQIFGTKN